MHHPAQTHCQQGALVQVLKACCELCLGGRGGGNSRAMAAGGNSSTLRNLRRFGALGVWQIKDLVAGVATLGILGQDMRG